MSLIASVYDTDENGFENRINFWLQLDSWTAEEAALLFMDIEPHSIKSNINNEWLSLEFLSESYSFSGSMDKDEPAVFSDNDGNELLPTSRLEKQVVKNIQRSYQDFLRLLNNKEDKSPMDWIAIADQKSIDVPWLAYAASGGLIKLEDYMAEAFHEIFNDKNNSQHPVELELAFRAYLFARNNPGKKTPKQRITDWLKKNTSLTQDAIKRCAVVANWNKKGGAPKTGQDN